MCSKNCSCSLKDVKSLYHHPSESSGVIAEVNKRLRGRNSSATMWTAITTFLLLSASLVAHGHRRTPLTGGNDRPIVGILALDTTSSRGKTLIPATYVRYLEQAGARVVPIRGGQPEEYYSQMVNWTNGILIPGGAVNFATSLIGRSARFVYDRALQLNKAGDYYPMWGTCMGFQLLCYLTQGENLLKPTDSANVTWPLTLAPDYMKSRMLGKASQDILKILTTKPVTQNQHRYSILTKVFETSKLGKFFTKLSTNKDRQGTEFISTVEARDFPIYGVQWHPEKANFNWSPNYNINHSPDAVKVSQYMANFFVSEARKSSHRFPSVNLEATSLIQNYNQTYFDDGTFFDNYYIDPRDAPQKDTTYM